MCSTSPEAEPPGFCSQLRAVLARMLANPRPLDTLFPGARPRTYSRHPATGEWRLRGEDTARAACAAMANMANVLRDDKDPWKHVTGPAAACIITLGRIGWDIPQHQG